MLFCISCCISFHLRLTLATVESIYWIWLPSIIIMFGELCIAYFIVLCLKWSADENERLWSGDRINMSWSITCEKKTLRNCSWLAALLYISVCCCCWMNANAITFLLTIWMNGRAVLYRMNATLIKIPMMMPNSSDRMRQAKSVVMKGIISTRLQRQISTISCVSTIKIMAQMMTAARVLFGMYWKESVRNPNDSSTMHPVTMPPRVVRTPLALFTAVRVNDPVVGIDWKKEPHKLHRPSANISWVASIVFPLAVTEIDMNGEICVCLVDAIGYCLQNDFATAILSKIDINGIAMTEDPKWVIISKL